jgi:hypothetical protein
MSEQVIVNFTYSVDDYVRALLFIRRRNPILRYIYLLPLILIVVLLLWLYLLNPNQVSSTFSSPGKIIPILIGPGITIPILYLLSRRKTNFLMKWQIRKQMESSPAMRQPQRLMFDNDGLDGQTILSSGHVRWDAIIEATESEDDFYFFTSKKIAMFVPKRSFETIEEQNAVRRIAALNLLEKAETLQPSRSI